MKNRHVNIRVIGSVQGVYFRASAKDAARRLELLGFVRNEPDGSVYLEVEGPAEKVEQLIAWCGSGPPNAVVREVIVQDGIIGGFEGFEIRRW